MTRENLDNVFLKMVEMYEGQPERIQHFTKVHSYAAYIGRQEKLGEKTMFILETAAYTHDIGIKKAEELYHASNGRLQQELGPGEAEIMLKELHFPEDVIERGQISDRPSPHLLQYSGDRPADSDRGRFPRQPV